MTYLDPDEQGLTTPAMVQAALREDTILVSVMHANNAVSYTHLTLPTRFEV